MNKRARELRKQFPTAKIERTRGGHIRIQLTNGKSIITSSTPSCWRTGRNMRAEARRSENANAGR